MEPTAMSDERPSPQARAPVRHPGRNLRLGLALGLMAAAGAATAAPPGASEATIGTGAAILEQMREDYTRIRNEAVRNMLIVGGVSLAALLVVLVYAGRQCKARVDPQRAIGNLPPGSTPIEVVDESGIANLILENARESIVITDAAGTILRVNQAYCQLTGYNAEELIGKNQRILSAGRHERSFFESMWEALLQEGRWEGKIWNRRKDGNLFLEHLIIVALPNRDGTPRHYVGIFSDITHQGLDPAQIGELAFYDPLTGLATHALLIDHLYEAARHSKRSGRHAVLFYLNLDDFSAINRRLGHAAGDALLKDFAERLDGTVRQVDTVARPGGDEFAVIMDEMASLKDVPRVADKLLTRLSTPFEFEGQPVPLNASMGISLYPTHSDEIDRLVSLARDAMTQAKAAGKHRWVLHESTETTTPDPSAAGTTEPPTAHQPPVSP
jgi:diguanylate cyclase (GGDEF)-like protein/PAS domain S-box-containing protein